MAEFAYRRAVEAELARSPEVQRLLRAKAEGVATEARRIARAEAYLSGDYHDGIEATGGIEDGKAIGRVNANDWKSWLIEAGSSRRPATATLRRALDRADKE